MDNCICPKCNSTEWDWANIGFTDTVQCLNCGNVYVKGVKDAKVVDVERVQRERERSDRWPFPTIDKPLTPLTDKEVKKYNKAKIQNLGDASL